MIKYQLLFLSLFFLLAGCSSKRPVTVPPEPSPGTFFSADKGRITESDLAVYLEDKDFILIGESHNNACDHQAQARVIKLMSRAGHKVVLGLEMVNIENQDVLEEFNKGRISIDDLPAELGWEKNWGYDFDLYLPVFEAAQTYSVPIYALNLPGHVTGNISRYGLQGLSSEDAGYLPEKIIYPPQEQKQMLKEQFALHQDLIDSDQARFERFLTAQSVWDSKMAFEAVRAHEKEQKPVLILAGTGHVDKGQGIEHRLRILAPESRVSSMVPVRSPEDISYANPYYYLCPPARPKMRLGIVAAIQEQKVLVRKVIPRSPAEKAGLEKGDQIVLAGHEEVSSLADLHRAALKALEDDQNLKLEVLRSGKPRKIEVPF